jgi:pimeloyl-ACP methyl ester carboxylesterase
MNEYRFAFDEAYVVASLARYRRQRKVYPWFIAVKIVCFLGLAALLGIIVVVSLGSSYSGSTAALFAAILPAVFIVLLLLGPRLDYALLKRNLRKSPFYGGEVHFSFSEKEVAVATPKSQGTLAWSAFTAAKRSSDGFLLFSGPSLYHWLPDSSLVAGAVGDVERLFRENVRPYERAAA